MSTCRSCHAPVVWAVTTRGKRIPLDPAPVEHGNIVLGVSGRSDPIAIVVPAEQILLADGPRFISHFATCPNSARWRNPR